MRQNRQAVHIFWIPTTKSAQISRRIELQTLFLMRSSRQDSTCWNLHNGANQVTAQDSSTQNEFMKMQKCRETKSGAKRVTDTWRCLQVSEQVSVLCSLSCCACFDARVVLSERVNGKSLPCRES